MLVTAGTPFTLGRSIGILATAAGTITLTLPSGRSIPLPVNVGWNNCPFAATGFALLGGAAGAVYNLP